LGAAAENFAAPAAHADFHEIDDAALDGIASIFRVQQMADSLPLLQI